MLMSKYWKLPDLCQCGRCPDGQHNTIEGGWVIRSEDAHKVTPSKIKKCVFIVPIALIPFDGRRDEDKTTPGCESDRCVLKL